ncbi:HAMP domain-containing methyl-accepting chemotaxis protein [Alteromonas sp. a30]|uniref:HAMP domain-containing methyl-accepting chemotaxis protein n=1 Tax=Alteromonas sp. a30 TaxID=2730917 RepID=UPI00227EAE0E|nr:methyl-accepting chemotaxis protein [Alteromonas sp. a30]MCY7294446.1 methyl-accepting chemotaxis protein [Alteromonas sp. a30]
MNITVALRIIGGFTTISVLLFVISFTSLINLSNINDASDEVIDLAIPTLVTSDRLKILLSQVNTSTYKSYFETNLSRLENEESLFKKLENDFEKDIKRLKQVVVNEEGIRNATNKLDPLYQAYFGSVNLIFENKRKILEINRALDGFSSDVEDFVDDTSTLILDFNDSRATAQNKALKSAAKIGESVDTALMSVVTTSNNFLKTQTKARAETLGSEVRILIERINSGSDEMLSKANGKDDSGALEEMKDNINELNDLILGSSGIIAQHNHRLNLIEQSEATLKTAIQQMDSTSAQLDQVVSLGDKKADDIKAEVGESVSNSRISTIIITLLSIAAAIAIGFFTVRAITRPLREVNTLLNVVATGDLTHQLDDSSKDEFGELAKNCNALINSLKTLISGISSGATQLAAASEQTSSVTEQTTRSIQEQKSQVSQVATATTELNSTAQMVAQSAEDTLAQIGQANKEAETVKHISENNKKTILVLSGDVDSASEVINKVHQDSASIGSILDVIRGIADQTNLLALNAAIEAARAGEQGRGFAVVADEVRTLASRTQESTQEIQSMIEILQSGAEQAVSVMQKGKEQTSLCVEQAEKAAEALNSITAAVQEAHNVSTQIEQAAKEQHTVSRDISEKLENIVAIAEETATGAQHTSRASQEVASLSEELQSSVRKFQV